MHQMMYTLPYFIEYSVHTSIVHTFTLQFYQILCLLIRLVKATFQVKYERNISASFSMKKVDTILNKIWYIAVTISYTRKMFMKSTTGVNVKKLF